MSRPSSPISRCAVVVCVVWVWGGGAAQGTFDSLGGGRCSFPFLAVSQRPFYFPAPVPHIGPHESTRI